MTETDVDVVHIFCNTKMTSDSETDFYHAVFGVVRTEEKGYKYKLMFFLMYILCCGLGLGLWFLTPFLAHLTQRVM